MKATCPVCGLPGEPHVNLTICPCCGTAFGTDDTGAQGTHHRLMWNWIQAGCLWFGPKVPKRWSADAAHAQLVAAGLITPGGADLRATVAPEQRDRLSA